MGLLIAASIPASYLFQSWMQLKDPHFVLVYGFYPPTLLSPQAWPGVMTSVFLHAGWAHAGANALGALIFAPPLARLMTGAKGAIGLVLFYLVCGLVANVGYGLIHLNSDSLLIGASGAVFGLIGGALRLLGRRSGRLRSLTDPRFLMPAAAMMLVNVATGLIGFAPGVQGADIAWEAHAVGLVAGALLIGPWARIFGRGDQPFDSPPDLRDAAAT